MDQKVGYGSLLLKEAPFLIGASAIVGKKEGEGPLRDYFDQISEDAFFGEKTWEEAEAILQKKTVGLLLDKCKRMPNEIDYIFAGDLLGQVIATYFGLKDYKIPMFGIYGACSTCGEALGLSAMTVASGYANQVLAVTSSHFASAEKEFRFPLEYANERPLSATWTVTGAGAFMLSDRPNGFYMEKGTPFIPRITGITTGRVVDYGIKDTMNMGAAMAPAAADLIARNLNDFNRKPEDYDLIITGDLGTVGQTLLFELMKEKGFDISAVHEDCGMKIFDESQKTGAGGSGCGCSAVTLAAYYLPKICSGKLKRILFVPTGALLSPVSFHEGKTIPGIAHGVVIEGEKNRWTM